MTEKEAPARVAAGRGESESNANRSASRTKKQINPQAQPTEAESPKWRRGTFTVAGYQLTSLAGWTWRSWGIVKDRHGDWSVFHLPTGRQIWPRWWANLWRAQAFCERIDSIMDWRAIGVQNLLEKQSLITAQIEAEMEKWRAECASARRS